jgi:YIF1
MSQILMSSANSVSSCSLGGINHGHAKYVVQRQALVNFSHRGTISTRRTFTSPVRHPPYDIPLLARSDIPLAMAFVTYILVAALQSGLQSRFHPEIFGVVATKAIVVLVLDFLLVKGGCYLLGIQGTNPIVDLIAYSGYKFVGCVVALANSSTKLTPLQRDHNAFGWTDWVFAHVILNRVRLHFFSKRIFPRACPVYFESVQLTYLS